MIDRIKSEHVEITVQHSVLGVALRLEVNGCNAITHANLSPDQAEALARALDRARGMLPIRSSLQLMEASDD